MQSVNVEKMKQNRRTLLIVLVIFVLPVLISSLMYFTEWRPSSTVNHGELILPARPIADGAMTTLDGKQVKISDLRDKWTMVYFDSSACPEACMSQIYFMRQVHASQGKNYDRIQRVFMLTDSKSVDELKSKLKDYPDMLVWTGDQLQTAKLTHDFGVDTQSADFQRYIYLLDQQGNLMMRYKPGVEPAGVRKDIERLLKYSSEK
ncbi:MAG TPA: SCO family protein [Gallionellaceae bacterium]|nr:SCO family protein [Gallionellaceae bacterium]